MVVVVGGGGGGGAGGLEQIFPGHPLAGAFQHQLSWL